MLQKTQMIPMSSRGDIELVEKSEENIEVTFKTDKGLRLVAPFGERNEISSSQTTHKRMRL